MYSDGEQLYLKGGDKFMAEEKQYKCNMCGATFKSQPELMEHVKKEHKKS